MQAVLDSNVIISAALSRTGAPAKLIAAWGRGEFELIVSEQLMAELGRALVYPKLAERIPPEAAASLLRLLAAEAMLVDDPPGPPPIASPDPGDDYLITLSASHRAPLISGDKHLLSLSSRLPVLTAREFLELLLRPDGPSSG